MQCSYTYMKKLTGMDIALVLLVEGICKEKYLPQSNIFPFAAYSGKMKFLVLESGCSGTFWPRVRIYHIQCSGGN